MNEEFGRMESLIQALRGSEMAYNENFDTAAAVVNNKNTNNGGDGDGDDNNQLQLDLMYRWMRCKSNMNRPDVSIIWFQRLCQHYSESHRHYHTLMHLEEMFLYHDLLTQHYYNNHGRQQHATEPMTELDQEAIVLATFFHDAVYNVHSVTNEEDSAVLFQTYVQELRQQGVMIMEGLEPMVLQLILATKQHEVSTENSTCLALFLDLDMSVLGKIPQAYSCYAALIRQEYCHVPHEVYCEKRAMVLENFLKQPQIYGTQIMLEALEQRARDNLEQEIQNLRRGIIPNISMEHQP